MNSTGVIGGGCPNLAVLQDAENGLAYLIALSGLTEAPLNQQIAAAASLLQGGLRSEPTGRPNMPRARVLGVNVMTRKSAILA